MGRLYEHQEIINTPEAKGMRTLPSARGTKINFGNLKTKLSAPLPTPQMVPRGRLHTHSDYAWLKTDAESEVHVKRTTYPLQQDPQTDELTEVFLPAQLHTEFAGLDDANWTPPESQIAANATRILVAGNSSLAVFDKSGAELLNCRLSDVFGVLTSDAIIFNPKILFDQFSQNWVLVASALGTDERDAWFLLAVSQTEDPLGDWWLWALDARLDGIVRTPYWADGLGLAVDANSLYLTANMFTGQGQFVYAKLRVLGKKEALTGGLLQGWDFWQLRDADGSPAFGLQPAINLRAAGAQYLLNATRDGQGVMQWTITQQSRQTPMLTRRFIPTTAFHLAPNAKSSTLGRELDTGDTRLSNVIFRHGLLWTAHTVAAYWGQGANVSAIYWLQINPRAGCVTQQGIFGAPGRHYFCPAAMVDGEGNFLLAFNRASETERPSLRYTGRSEADEQNLLHASELLQRSLVADATAWSASSGIAMAPDDPDMWIIGQYAATEDDWATWVGAVAFSTVEEESFDTYEDHPIFV